VLLQHGMDMDWQLTSALTLSHSHTGR